MRATRSAELSTPPSRPPAITQEEVEPQGAVRLGLRRLLRQVVGDHQLVGDPTILDHWECQRGGTRRHVITRSHIAPQAVPPQPVPRRPDHAHSSSLETTKPRLPDHTRDASILTASSHMTTTDSVRLLPMGRTPPIFYAYEEPEVRKQRSEET